jgi:CRISPR/Cas system-associated endonuclease Cas1
LEITKILLENDTNVSIRAIVLASTHKISIIHNDKKSLHGEILFKVKIITHGQKITLFLTLELKSSLHL